MKGGDSDATLNLIIVIQKLHNLLIMIEDNASQYYKSISDIHNLKDICSRFIVLFYHVVVVVLLSHLAKVCHVFRGL